MLSCFLCGLSGPGTHISGEHGMICAPCVEECYGMLQSARKEDYMEEVSGHHQFDHLVSEIKQRREGRI